MRPIKFRAYLHDYKTIAEVEFVSLIFNEIIARVEGELYELELGEYELMQYTGLKDKNGKEIYEQDILEVESFEGSKSVVRVVFEDGCFCHIGHLGDLRTYPLRDFLFNGSKVQVIGNIFQHPHLLEEST